MPINSIKQVTLPGQIWNIALDENEGFLYLDTRSNEQIVLVKLSLKDLSFEQKNVENSWRTKLVDANQERLAFIEYLDDHNPNNYQYFALNWKDLVRDELKKLPISKNKLNIPHIYEQGSAYHKTVSDFLALELNLSCEYLEWNDKIIISYYLRSDNGFDRHLLLLDNGVKEWKLLQDKQMQGFSSGSFFVFDDQLIFIKDRNEVCFYTF